MSVHGIIGKKVGMTQVYAEDGRAYPVTVIEAGPCVVVQRKAKDKDGYSAVQLGLVEARKAKKVTKPMKGHFDKAGLPPCRVLREFRVADGAVIKRHHFRGGAATHGSMFHRAPGSIGASAYPSRVLPGMKAAGHMGTDRVTTRNLEVVRVDAGN